jgi:hypothetical protein
MRVLVIAVVIAACAPTIDSPVARQRAIDREDAHALAAQLSTLPGVLAASALLERPAFDPLTQETTSASAAIALMVDARADRARLAELARTLTRAAAPEIAEPELAVVLSGGRPELARLGPFVVAARDRDALIAMLAAVLALLASAAGYVAWRERP